MPRPNYRSIPGGGSCHIEIPVPAAQDQEWLLSDRLPLVFFGKVRTFWPFIPSNASTARFCVTECPVNAIFADKDVPDDQHHFIQLNAELARCWPSITMTKAPLEEAEKFKNVKHKLSLLER